MFILKLNSGDADSSQQIYRSGSLIFMCVGEDSRIANWCTMKNTANAIKPVEIDIEFHKYPGFVY